VFLTFPSENGKGRLNRVETAYSLTTHAREAWIELRQHDIVGKPEMRDPRSESRSTRRVQDRQAGRRVGERENLDERNKPRTTNSLKKGHKCRIRNHEGKRAPERKGKGRLECRRGEHGRDMYEAAGMGDERLGFSNQATSVPVNIGS